LLSRELPEADFSDGAKSTPTSDIRLIVPPQLPIGPDFT
jgi:hypothetical protein